LIGTDQNQTVSQQGQGEHALGFEISPLVSRWSKSLAQTFAMLLLKEKLLKLRLLHRCYPEFAPSKCNQV
jgi:hypothetical protein